MTPEQLATLKAAIDGDPQLSAFPNTADGAFAIAELLNQDASPTFYVYRINTPISEIMDNGFNWTLVDNLTVGKARIWEWMTSIGHIDASKANVRAGVNASITGTGQQFPDMRTAIYSHCQEPATRFEQLYAIGSGTSADDQGVGPATRVLFSPVTYQEVQAARAL